MKYKRSGLHTPSPTLERQRQEDQPIGRQRQESQLFGKQRQEGQSFGRQKQEDHLFDARLGSAVGV